MLGHPVSLMDPLFSRYSLSVRCRLRRHNPAAQGCVPADHGAAGVQGHPVDRHLGRRRRHHAHPAHRQAAVRAGGKDRAVAATRRRVTILVALIQLLGCVNSLYSHIRLMDHRIMVQFS